ncbi:MAG TPA: hypothetical protein VFU62_12165 [Hanamia sp.]|jgi:hypothetical protein|nr:hypothetical protein [Hanamia sp.]
MSQHSTGSNTIEIELKDNTFKRKPIAFDLKDFTGESYPSGQPPLAQKLNHT